MKLEFDLLIAYAFLLAAFGWLAIWLGPRAIRTLRQLSQSCTREFQARWSHGAPRSALPHSLPDVRTRPLF
jgi:hypothetical protein